MLVIRFALGFIVLVIGRQAYAMFVGAVGFILGIYLSSKISIVESSLNSIVLPLFLGVFSGFTVYLLKRWAVRLAGFIAGGYLLQNLPVILGAETTYDTWYAFVIAGIICTVLLLLWFEITLVILSAILGVTFIFQSISLGTLDPALMFFILTFFGIITQFVLLQYGNPAPD